MAHGPDTPALLLRIADTMTDNFTTLNVSFMNITSLPPLPEHIHVLNCHNTYLTVLPYLHEGLVVLNCSHTLLTSLPALPDTLSVLNCAHTRITYLPELPKHLMTLWCNNTMLTTLPHIPVTLQYFFCYKSPLILQREEGESVPDYNRRWREWREDQASKPRVQERTRVLKEELMMEAWHPDRVERWLEAGVELDCM